MMGRVAGGEGSPEGYRPLPEEAAVAAAPSDGGAQERTPLQHSSSSRLLRAASMTLSGGTVVLPPGAHPADSPTRWPSINWQAGSRRHRAQNLRRGNTVAVQQRMMEEIWSRWRIRISLFMIVLVSFMFTMVVLFYYALFAVLLHFSEPCDQPLNLYLFTTFVVGQTAPQIVKRLQARPWAQSQRATLAISMAGSIPGWMVILWGVCMVKRCQTCQYTNPKLFFPTRQFVYGQVVLFVLTTIFFSVGFTGVLAYVGSISDRLRPGCEAAVHELPKVPPGDEELIDAEDGKLMECPICAEPFEQPRVVVRTHCSHHFHEQCLARWCKNHIDCPMCRAPVGEVDQGSA